MTMTDLSNKPISYTGSHPLELAYRALLARVEAAEAEAAEWKAAYADNELYGLALMQRRDELEARVAELEAQVASHLRNYNGLYDDYHEMRHRSADIGAALHAARQRVAESSGDYSDPWVSAEVLPPSELDGRLFWTATSIGIGNRRYSQLRAGRYRVEDGGWLDQHDSHMLMNVTCYWPRPLPDAPTQAEAQP